MSKTTSDTAVQCRVVCKFVTPKDLVNPISKLKCTVGVKRVIHETNDEGVVLIATIDPKHSAEEVIARIRRLASVWEENYGFPARVEV